MPRIELARAALVYAALPFVLVACLDVPPGPVDASLPPEDAGPPAAEVHEVLALDSLGEAWPLGGIPRSVQIRALTSVGVRDLEDWVVLRGAPDEALLEDLAETPLRQSHATRAVSVERRRIEGGALLTLERLSAGDVLTVALLGRAATVDGRRFRQSWVATLTVSDIPRAGADVLSSWPPDGAAAVPAEIERLVVRFDAPVSGELQLDAASGRVPSRTDIVDCHEVGWPNGFCLAALPDTRPPEGPLNLSLADELVDGSGARPSPWRASLMIISEVPAPPALLDATCALDEIAFDGVCALLGEDRVALRARATGPVRASLDGAGRRAITVAPRGEVALSLSALEPSQAFTATLRVTGLGDRMNTQMLPLSTTEPLMALTITEIRADPHGREPAQELIEVLNFGDVALDLNGISIPDCPDTVGDVVVGAAPLAPGARALLVGDDFDADASEDTPAPPGVPLIRVGRSLASGGLSNSGEPLYLRDAEMRRLAFAPAVATGEGRCLQRSDEDDPRATAFVVTDCSPGRAP